jgi:transposase
VDVPAKLAARVRVLSVGHGRRSDPDDAVSVAVAAQCGPQLRQVGVEDQAVELHLLTKRRQDLVAVRTQTINRLHRLLMDLVPGGARRNLTAKRAAALLDQVAPTSIPAVTRHQLAQELVTDMRRLDRRIAEVEAHQDRGRPGQQHQPAGAVRGRAGAGRHLPRRGRRHPPIPQQASFRRPHRHRPAPLEASSGQVVRHLLSRAGDRKLNHALYMMAMVQVRRPSAGQACYRRKLAEAKSPKEALRCLKRRLSDAVYRCLLADQHLQPRRAAYQRAG